MALVLVAGVVVYLLFRDFTRGTVPDVQSMFEIRRSALVDAAAQPAAPTFLAPPSSSLAVPPSAPVAPDRPAGATTPGADTWAGLWAARKGPRPFLRCRDGQDLLQQSGRTVPPGAPGLDAFMSEVDLALGPSGRPLRAAQGQRSSPASTDGVKVLPYTARESMHSPQSE
jgi:hypothetical protein